MSLSIPLPVLLGLVVGGLTVTTAPLHWMGWSETATLESAEAAAARFALDYPDHTVTEVVLADDAAAALLALEAGAIGLVAAVGDRFVVRTLQRGSLSAVHSDPAQLLLHLSDIAFPRARIRLPASPLRDRWVARLGTCVSSPAS